MLLAFLPLPVKSLIFASSSLFVTAMMYDVPNSSLAIVGSHEVLDFEQIEKDRQRSSLTMRFRRFCSMPITDAATKVKNCSQIV